MVISERKTAIEHLRREIYEISEVIDGQISPIPDPPTPSISHIASTVRARRRLNPYLGRRQNDRGNDRNVSQPVASQNGQGSQTTRSTNPSNSPTRRNVSFPPPVIGLRSSHISQPGISQDGETSQRRGGSQNRNVSMNNVYQNGQSSQINRPRIVSIPSTSTIGLLPFPLRVHESNLASRASMPVSEQASISSRITMLSHVASLLTHSWSSQVSENSQVRNPRPSQSNESRNTSADSVRRVPNPSSCEVLPLRDPNINAYQYEPRTFQPSLLTLKQACSIMVTFDLDLHYELIKKTLCKFSVRIYGLEDCPTRDLRLAVFFFLEEYFSIKPMIELCVRHIPDEDDPNVVGVLFERGSTSRIILKNLFVLKNRNYRIEPNNDVNWIVRNYDD